MTSYLWSFFVYSGKTTTVDSTPGVLKSTSTVLRLIKPLLNKGYTLWMDNWFNSPLLARFLKRNKTDCAGTLRTNRANVPPAFSRINMAEGHYFGRHASDVAVLSWQDKKKVSTISTYHGAEMELGPSRGRPNIYKPKVVRDYNKYMGGVDKKDQMLEPYLLERKRCQKWYHKMFKHLLNVSIHNSIVMYRQSSSLEATTLMLRTSLVSQLADKHLLLAQRTMPARRVVVNDKFSNPSRLRPGNHFLKTNFITTDTDLQTETHNVQPPPVANKKRRLRCIWCADRNRVEKRTSLICEACEVPLCMEPCFKYYHTCL